MLKRGTRSSKKRRYTIELPYNVTSWDRRKSVVVGELPLWPNYNKPYQKWLFGSMPKSDKV